MKCLSVYLTSILLFFSCSGPKQTVFEDKSLLHEENVKFCFSGDMGKDTEHQKTIAKAMNEENCHRIFFLGDLVYPKGIESVNHEDFQKKFLYYYEPLLDENPNLIINILLGNHDHKGKPDAWKKISSINERFFFPGYYYMIDYGGICFVALDTSFYYYLNQVTETAQQTAWIQKLQPRLKECEVKIALTHHPFKGRGLDRYDDWEGTSGALKVFLDTYVIGNFDIHLAGHVHLIADDGRDEGTRMLISGAGGETRGDNKAGYIVLNWQPKNKKRISYTLREVDIETTVIDESLQEMEDYDNEYIINKSAVEPNFLLRMWIRVRNFFGGDN